jgi:hypothetical protein
VGLRRKITEHRHFSANNALKLLLLTVQISSLAQIQRRYLTPENTRSNSFRDYAQKSGGVTNVNLNLRATGQIPTPAPSMLVITKQQPSRKTRPPVPSSELGYHPYVSQGPTNPVALPKTKICPVVDVESSGPKIKSSRRQRRKRLRESTRQRPSPRFWRPDPSWSGPCRGYAFGYPSSFEIGPAEKEYQRDRMKKSYM